MALRILFLYSLLLMSSVQARAQDAGVEQADSTHGMALPLRHSGYQNALTLGIPQMVFQKELRFLTAGFEFQHYFGRKGRFSMHIPVYLGMVTAPHFDERSSESRYREGNTFSMAHGFRYHPFGNRDRADLSVGLQLAAGLIHTKQYTIDRQRTLATGSTREGFLALLLQAGLDFQTFHRTIVGVHVSAGPAHMEGKDMELRMQAGIKVGGRF